MRVTTLSLLLIMYLYTKKTVQIQTSLNEKIAVPKTVPILNVLKIVSNLCTNRNFMFNLYCYREIGLIKTYNTSVVYVMELTEKSIICY